MRLQIWARLEAEPRLFVQLSMRSTFSFLIVFFVLAASSAFGQSVVITKKKTVYRRPKPMIDFKRTFTVTRPVVKASTPALSKKITAAVSPESVLELNIKEELGEMQWLEESDFETVYNKNGILCIRQWMTGTAAYPDSVTKYVVVDTKTGTKPTIQELFSDLDGLAAKLKKLQTAQVKKAILEIKKDPENADADPEQLFESTDLTANELDQFSISADGVTFYYDYGFPHVLEALQPDGEFKLTWAELKPFIRPDGLLARFIR